MKRLFMRKKSMCDQHVACAEPLLREGFPRIVLWGEKAPKLVSLIVGLCFAAFLSSPSSNLSGGTQHNVVQEVTTLMASKSTQPGMLRNFPQTFEATQMQPARVWRSLRRLNIIAEVNAPVLRNVEAAAMIAPTAEVGLVDRNAPSQNTPSGSAGSNFVFVQRFPMARSRLVPRWIRRLLPFYHTDLLVVPRTSFSEDDQTYLDRQIKGMSEFAKIPQVWWEKRNTSCIQIGYGYSECDCKCCNVKMNETMVLNRYYSVVEGLDLSKKTLFLYGTTDLTAEKAYKKLCAPESETLVSNWDGNDFHIYNSNCNTFTSTMLDGVYGLSKKHPMEDFGSLGFFDTRWTGYKTDPWTEDPIHS